MWRSDLDLDPGHRANLLAAEDNSVADKVRICRTSIARADECPDRHLAARSRKSLWASPCTTNLKNSRKSGGSASSPRQIAGTPGTWIFGNCARPGSRGSRRPGTKRPWSGRIASLRLPGLTSIGQFEHPCGLGHDRRKGQRPDPGGRRLTGHAVPCDMPERTRKRNRRLEA